MLLFTPLERRQRPDDQFCCRGDPGSIPGFVTIFYIFFFIIWRIRHILTFIWWYFINLEKKLFFSKKNLEVRSFQYIVFSHFLEKDILLMLEMIISTRIIRRVWWVNIFIKIYINKYLFLLLMKYKYTLYDYFADNVQLLQEKNDEA